MSIHRKAKLAFELAARTALRIAAQSGVARLPNGQWYDIPKNFHPMDYLGLFNGNYEKAESQILKDNFEDDRLIIEIGANIGVVTRMACETKLKESGIYVCVEANPLPIPYLKKNLSRMDIPRDIRIVEAAIGVPHFEGETQTFFQRNNLSSGLGSTLKPDPIKETRIEVPVRSLSSIVDEFAGNADYSLICDAEGAEISILSQDSIALQKCKQIAIELHHPELTGQSVTPSDMIEKIKTLGFHHVRALEDTHYFKRVPCAF